MNRTWTEVADHEWRATRHQAETVDCPNPNCGATTGHTCRNQRTGAELHNLPAHHSRIRKAREPR